MTIDFDLRLKALSRLSKSTTSGADAALRREIGKATASLQTDQRYDILEQQLKILEVVGFRASQVVVDEVHRFIIRLQTLEVTYSPEEQRFLGEEIGAYRNAESLTVDAIDVLATIRYLETEAVLRLLFDLSVHESDDVQKRAVRELEELSSYKIQVIYGSESQGGIGFTTQERILEVLFAMSEEELGRYFSAILTLATNLLSLTMEQTSWTYSQVSLTRGEVPAAASVPDIRSRTIELLKRVYELADLSRDKLAVISAISAATTGRDINRHHEASVQMVAHNTLSVLEFFRSLVSREDYSVVQKVEHRSYWIFYHAVVPEVASAALDIEKEISNNAEYQIYKTLIGFDGIFGDWQEIKDERRQPREDDVLRRDRARQLAAGIAPDQYAEWRQRIVKFAQTQSDDLATFPVFFYFLEQVAVAHAEFAFDLVCNHTLAMERFLIPLLRALSVGPEEQATKSLIREWMQSGRYLYQSIKQFLSNEELDADLLTSLLEKAIEFGELNSIALVMSVVISNYGPGKKQLVARFFVPALQALTDRRNADWIFDAWYRREARSLIGDLDQADLELVLRNLMHLKTIDYHAEEILYLIANREPEKVVLFLCARLSENKEGDRNSRRLYDAIPFELHKLKEPLAKIPRYAVQKVRETYDGNYGLFIYRGAHLLHIIFPDFPESFESELLKVLESKRESDVLFVLSILRTYKGELALHRVCKEVVRILPSESRLRTEVAIALESTGVVSGEFGFVEAYERKKEEMKDWLIDQDDKIREFAKWYVGTLDEMSAAERKRAQEDIALRKQKYGE